MIGLGSSRAISPEMKEAVREKISELSWEKFALYGGSGDVDALWVEELVDRWVLFQLEPPDRDVALQIAQIEHVTNALMASLGAHEKAIELYRNEFIRCFGSHLDVKRVWIACRVSRRRRET